MGEFTLSNIEKYRYKYILNTEQSVVLEMILPKIISETPTAQIPDILETMCGVTSGLFTYAITSMDINDIKNQNVTLNDVTNNKTGIYQVDLFSENDHSFILIINNNISTIIQSYSLVYRIRIDNYPTPELMFMLKHISVYYNRLFFVNRKYVQNYDVMITRLIVKGDPIENFINMPHDDRWSDYTNKILKKIWL